MPSIVSVPKIKAGSNTRVLLDAAKRFHHHKGFSYQELVVAAWIANRSMFGLRGFHHESADSRKVGRCLARQLIRPGLVEKVGSKYRVPAKGREA